MTEYATRPALFAHALSMAPYMRAEDVAEVWASHHWTPLEALAHSLDNSLDARTGFADGVVVCMYGVVAPCLVADAGVPWLLTSQDILGHKLHYLRESRAWVATLRSRYRRLHNYVDARYDDAVGWLSWLGFDILDPEPYGPEGRPFHPFVMES